MKGLIKILGILMLVNMEIPRFISFTNIQYWESCNFFDVKTFKRNLLMDLNFESFNFEDLAGSDPFGEQKASYVDERFYKLTKDENGEGAAIIRFLPDPEKTPIQRLYKINVNNVHPTTKEKRWFSDWSPQNINQPDPFQDEWAKHWRAGRKEEARKFSRQTRYIANILVVKDPKCPENEGKVFLLDMSQSLKDIVQNALMPSKSDMMLGKQPLQLFNPIQGNSFKLASKKGANGFINYDSSGPVETVDAVVASKEEAVNLIKTKCYKLSDFLKPEAYKTTEELLEKLSFVKFEEVSETPKPVVTSEEVTDTSAFTVKPPEAPSDVDDLLAIFK